MKNKKKIITGVFVVLLVVITISFVYITLEKDVSSHAATQEVQIEQVAAIGDNINLNQELHNIKYVFLIIGDGMGESQLEVGKLFHKVVTGDMSSNPSWDSFTNHIMVEPGSESAQGGSMIATGEKNEADIIAQRADGTNLTTILDVAEANGLSTGVITTDSLLGATPAAFISHADSRSNQPEILKGFLDTTIDFFAGGGMEYIFENVPSEYSIDAAGHTVERSTESIDLANYMHANGYTTYLGNDDAAAFKNSTITEVKVFACFTAGKLPYYYQQRMNKYISQMSNVPSLKDMTKAGIESLIQDPDGFMLVLEAARIDKAAHQELAEYVALEMGELDQTIEYIMQFYNEHPNETLIILTADHETGDYQYIQGAVDSLSTINEPLPWDSSAAAIDDYLKTNLNCYIDYSIIENASNCIQANTFSTDFDNRAHASANIVQAMESGYGIFSNSAAHSTQLVPLMTIGPESDLFNSCTSLTDIPHVISDILNWEDTLLLD